MKQNSWAVVTGATGGLGQAFAEYLAQSGHNLFLTGRKADVLAELADELTARFDVSVEYVRIDLAKPSEVQDLISQLSELEVETLVNNAGFGMLGEVAVANPDRLSEMVQVNCVALTDLTRAVLPSMMLRGKGTIINVASTAAFQPIPKMGAYAASKAYVLSFSQALWAELRGTGIRVTAICPGPTETGFFAAAGDDQVMQSRRKPAQVVKSTFKALERNRCYAVDGKRNALLARISKMAPVQLAMQVAQSIATKS